MLRSRWMLLIGMLVVVAILAWGWRQGGRSGTGADLVRLLPQADRRAVPLPVDEAIRVVTVTVNGEAKTCILAQTGSRIVFRVTPPSPSTFEARLAVDPAVWDKDGDGVLFRVGVAAGPGSYVELLSRHVDPAHDKADRRWIPVAVDLSPFSGREVSLILSTNGSVPGKPIDLRNDLALWAEPAVVAAR
jgi:hypothetical protein